MVSYSYCDNKPSPVCALVSTLNMFCRKRKEKIKIQQGFGEKVAPPVTKIVLGSEDIVPCLSSLGEGGS